MQQLNAESILAADDRKRERVEVPEWGGFVYVQSMSGSARQDFEEAQHAAEKQGLQMADHMRGRMVAACVCDEKGNRLFDDGSFEMVSGKSAEVLSRIFDVAARLSGLREEDVKELAGNSESGPGA